MLCTQRIVKKKKAKIPSRRFLGVSLHYNLWDNTGDVSALCLQGNYVFFLLSPTLSFFYLVLLQQEGSVTGDCTAKWSKAETERGVKGFFLKFIGHSHPTLQINDQCLQYFNHGSEEMH